MSFFLPRLAGIGLIDLLFLARDADILLRNAPVDERGVEFGLPGCLISNECLNGVLDGDFSGIVQCIQRIPIVVSFDHRL